MREVLKQELCMEIKIWVTEKGSFTKALSISLTLGGIVAEKNKDCLIVGNWEIKKLMSWIKPISTIKSTSSSTKIEKSSSIKTSLLIKSLSLPGVPTTTWGFLLISWICLYILAPPITKQE